MRYLLRLLCLRECASPGIQRNIHMKATETQNNNNDRTFRSTVSRYCSFHNLSILLHSSSLTVQPSMFQAGLSCFWRRTVFGNCSHYPHSGYLPIVAELRRWRYRGYDGQCTGGIDVGFRLEKFGWRRKAEFLLSGRLQLDRQTRLFRE